MKYFAYGSNMLPRRLQQTSRAPSAVFIGVGLLRGYRLRFHKRGIDDSAKCNMEPTNDTGDVVYGVLYDINPRDRERLDESEDCTRGGYNGATVSIELLHSAAATLAETYLAGQEFIDDSLKPYDWYQALVVAGALEHRLPAAYLTALRSISVLRDPDKQRREEALCLLGRYRGEFEAGRLIVM
jgi:hypothetical protein